MASKRTALNGNSHLTVSTELTKGISNVRYCQRMIWTSHPEGAGQPAFRFQYNQKDIATVEKADFVWYYHDSTVWPTPETEKRLNFRAILDMHHAYQYLREKYGTNYTETVILTLEEAMENKILVDFLEIAPDGNSYYSLDGENHPIDFTTPTFFTDWELMGSRADSSKAVCIVSPSARSVYTFKSINHFTKILSSANSKNDFKTLAARVRKNATRVREALLAEAVPLDSLKNGTKLPIFTYYSSTGEKIKAFALQIPNFASISDLLAVADAAVRNYPEFSVSEKETLQKERYTIMPCHQDDPSLDIAREHYYSYRAEVEDYLSSDESIQKAELTSALTALSKNKKSIADIVEHFKLTEQLVCDVYELFDCLPSGELGGLVYDRYSASKHFFENTAEGKKMLSALKRANEQGNTDACISIVCGYTGYKFIPDHLPKVSPLILGDPDLQENRAQWDFLYTKAFIPPQLSPTATAHSIYSILMATHQEEFNLKLDGLNFKQPPYQNDYSTHSLVFQDAAALEKYLSLGVST